MGYREYWNVGECRRPEGTYVNRSDGRVFIIERDGLGRQRRTVVGWSTCPDPADHGTERDTMRPNESFKRLYPLLWDEAFGKAARMPLQLGIGTFALTLAASWDNGLYACVTSAYGVERGNAIMDWCAYMIVDRSNAAQLFADRMSREVLFSERPHGDSWYANLFGHELTGDMHDEFRMLWLRAALGGEGAEVWLCIDGSNDDCQSADDDLAEFGRNKTGRRNKRMLGYITAVRATDGEPLTWFASPGGKVDCKAFQKIMVFLASYGVRVAGAIVDRGFCTPEVVRTLRRLGKDFVIMLPHDTLAFKSALKDLADEVRWEPKALVDGVGTFGASAESRIWAKHRDTAHVSLLFDGVSGAEASSRLIARAVSAMEAARAACEAGRRPKVEPSLKKIVVASSEDVEGEDGRTRTVWSVEYDYDAWSDALAAKGFWALATSTDMGARRAHELYRLRDSSEKVFATWKSQLGCDVARSWRAPAIESRMACCFIASVIRHRISAESRAEGHDTNRVIRKSDRVEVIQLKDGRYSLVRDVQGIVADVYARLGVTTETLEDLARDYNVRIMGPCHSQFRVLPGAPAPVLPGGGDGPDDEAAGDDEAPAADDADSPPPDGPDATDAEPTPAPSEPAPSEDAPTEPAEHEAAPATPPRRRPGRPRGSKDKKPRKRRSDAGIKRGPRKKKTDN